VADAWDLIGGNPAPGDPSGVQVHAASMSRMEEDVRSFLDVFAHTSQLVGLDVWHGVASDKFRSIVSELVPQIERVVDALVIVSPALRGFASALQSLQEQASAVLNQASSAAEDQASASATVSVVEATLDSCIQQQESVSQELLGIERSLANRLAVPGVVPLTDPVVLAYEREIDSIRHTLSVLGQEISERNQQLQEARNEVSGAENRLSRARAQAVSIRDEFTQLTRQTASRIEGEIGQTGRTTASFFRREFSAIDGMVDRTQHEVESVMAAADERIRSDIDATMATVMAAASAASREVEHLGKDAIRDAEVFAVAAAPIVHEVAEEIADVSSQVARVANDSSTVLEVAAIAVAVGGILGGVLTAQPEVVVGALFASDDLFDASKAASTVAEGADVVKTGADGTALASDEVLNASGQGNTIQTSADEHALVGDVTNDAESGLNTGIGRVLNVPDMSDVVDKAVDTGTFDAVSAGESVAVNRVEGWQDGRINSALGVSQ
jgi:chromosome segregation ATPase